MRARRTSGARVRRCEGARCGVRRCEGAKVRGSEDARVRGAHLRTVAPLHPRTLIVLCRHQFLEQGRGALAHGTGGGWTTGPSAATASTSGAGNAHRHVEGCAAGFVLEIQLRALLDEEADQRVAARHGNVQRAFAVVVHGVDVCAPGQQQGHRVDRVLFRTGITSGARRGNHQRGRLIAQSEIRIGTFVEQQSNQGRVTDLRRTHQRRRTLAE